MLGQHPAPELAALRALPRGSVNWSAHLLPKKEFDHGCWRVDWGPAGVERE